MNITTIRRELAAMGCPLSTKQVTVLQQIASAQQAGPELTDDALFFVRAVHDTFSKDIAQGYVTRDKTYAVDLLGQALAAAPAPEQRDKVELTDAEYRRGFTDGYNQRDAEVRGALV